MTIDEAFTYFPTLTTSRLHLRQLRSTDAEALFAIRSDPEVMEFMAGSLISCSQMRMPLFNDFRVFMSGMRAYSGNYA